MTVHPDKAYEALAAPFEHHYEDDRGIPFLSGEQVIKRLNEVFGVFVWSFKVLQHGINEDADQCWALGQLRVVIDDVEIVKEQFGGQQIKRLKPPNNQPDKRMRPVNLGDEQKGAATDAMKKCASLLGVGLYMMESKARKIAPGDSAQRRAPAQPRQQRQAPAPAGQPRQAPVAMNEIKCQGDGCGKNVEAAEIDGEEWLAVKLANAGARYYKRALCATCFEKAGGVPKQQAAAAT